MNCAPGKCFRRFAAVAAAGLLIAAFSACPKPASTSIVSAVEAGEPQSPAARDAQPAGSPPVAERRSLDGELLAQADEKPMEPAHPYSRRIKVNDFPKGNEWINSAPLSLQKELKGKFVLLDFWTYCCINCMHVLPELKKLEEKYANELVVVGVHTAKFETEKDAENIRAAVLRYEVAHPVINDSDHAIWNSFGVSSWPTILLIDPEGHAVWGSAGEFKAETVAEVLDRGIPYYRAKKVLNETPIEFELEVAKEPPTPLRFPGKVLADEAGDRLFITDSNHNRIVVTTLDGKLLDIIGSGKMGKADGSYEQASFDHPQGCALMNDILYVADTENHLLRKVDLQKKTVATIAGIGEQARHAWPGIENVQTLDDLPPRWVGPPLTTAISSPWALWVHKDQLYIAMAGPHQIWKMPLNESEIGPYAGNGREDIVDGPLLPRQPYGKGFSSFAQPSGLTSDGTWLYVADSEGSSIRAVPFDPRKEVRTVVGSQHLPQGRLFAFGDVDGPRLKAKLQHVLGVTYVDGQIYAADTYNNKIKVVDAKTGTTTTFVGTGESGDSDDEGTFDEPAGISHARGILYVADTNNHQIRTIDLKTKKVGTLEIEGLTPPGVSVTNEKPLAADQQQQVPLTQLKPVEGKVQFKVELELPRGWKINPLAPMAYEMTAPGDKGPLDAKGLGRKRLTKPAAEFNVAVPVTSEGKDEIHIKVNYYYCEEADEGVCKVGSVTFVVPLEISATAEQESVTLRHEIAG